MGYKPQVTTKGSVIVDIGGKDKNNALLLAAHVDTLGAMVATIKDNGNLKLDAIGGLSPNNTETENVKIITKANGTYEGTYQLSNASVHVNGEYNDTKRSWDNMEVVIDQPVKSKEDTEKLGIMPGDYVCFNPRTVVTKSGYIKSRFLDDKLSVGILLAYAKYLKEENGKLCLAGICLVAGLGPENNRRRDGSFEYYISEPVVTNDAKGVAPFILCYTEVLRRFK